MITGQPKNPQPGQRYPDELFVDAKGKHWMLTEQVLVEREWIDRTGAKPIVRRYSYVACRRVAVDKSE